MILATFSWLSVALAYAFLILALGIQNGRGEGGVIIVGGFAIGIGLAVGCRGFCLGAPI